MEFTPMIDPAAVRILIADDDAIVRLHLSTILSQHGYTLLFEADSGEAAIASVKEQPVDIALLDIYMDEISGWEAIAAIKVANPKVLVVMLTSSKAHEDLEAAFVHEVDGYFFKPIDSIAVMNNMNKLVAQLQDVPTARY
jgi:CheY-like chemotaxis protein